jgi:hypothetical protein
MSARQFSAVGAVFPVHAVAHAPVQIGSQDASAVVEAGVKEQCKDARHVRHVGFEISEQCSAGATMHLPPVEVVAAVVEEPTRSSHDFSEVSGLPAAAADENRAAPDG